jgi:hypothetical protein
MRWGIVSALVVLAGCDLGNPGDLVGEMTVTASLRENNCGTAVGTVPTTADTHVKLYERAGVLTWMGSLGTFVAEIDEEGNFVFRSSGSQVLRAEQPDGYGGVLAACTVNAAEEIRGKLVRRVTTDADAADGTAEPADGGETEPAPPASVTATDTLQVAPTSGSNCSDFVGVSSGLFQALPCRVILDLSGSEE